MLAMLANGREELFGNGRFSEAVTRGSVGLFQSTVNYIIHSKWNFDPLMCPLTSVLPEW